MTDPTARLLASTRRRLVTVTFGLVALLVVGVGAATAIAGLGVLDADVDRALAATVDAAVARLDGELPQEMAEGDETAPASSDTILLYLDANGALIADPSGVHLAGLPDHAAVVAVGSGAGRDLRTVVAGNLSIRLLTAPIRHGGATIGYVQGGFVLTLHDAQSQSLVLTIAMVGLAGLAAAVVVTLLVTGRALVPVRRSFDAQRRFVADASHELRTPAAIIRANADVLQREGLVDAEGSALADDIIGEADRLGRLVDDLLTLAASEAGGLVLQASPLDLTALAQDTVRNAAALAATHRIALVVEAGGAVSVVGDRDRLIQLLLINAIAHAPDGSVVRIGVATHGRHAELSVSDKGSGVPVAERARIFEPFTRLPRSRREGVRGAGLGLAIGSRIAAAHGGSIGVDSAPDGGARFTVSLPLDGRAG
jgi:two-component system sensor histidine kinase CiaH